MEEETFAQRVVIETLEAIEIAETRQLITKRVNLRKRQKLRVSRK